MKNLLLVSLVVSVTAFILVSLLTAGYLALYHLLRDDFGMGFWQVVFLYAGVATALSLLRVLLTKPNSR